MLQLRISSVDSEQCFAPELFRSFLFLSCVPDIHGAEQSLHSDQVLYWQGLTVGATVGVSGVGATAGVATFGAGVGTIMSNSSILVGCKVG